jgi:hypothetical protein
VEDDGFVLFEGTVSICTGHSGGLGLKILVARRQRGPTHNYKAIINFYKK